MEPVRTCVGCRKPDNRSNLQRYTTGQAGPVLDIEGRLPGRGAWVHQQCSQLAEDRGAIPRALRLNIQKRQK